MVLHPVRVVVPPGGGVLRPYGEGAVARGGMFYVIADLRQFDGLQLLPEQGKSSHGSPR